MRVASVMAAIRAWRLPAPAHIQLKRANGKPLAAEIRDLSINGMRLLSRRPLFSPVKPKHQPRVQTLLLGVGEAELRCKVTLVWERKGPTFWLTAVQFQRNSADQRTRSDFVFQGFLVQKNRRPRRLFIKYAHISEFYSPILISIITDIVP